MTSKQQKIEKEFVKQELKCLLEITLQLEDELNSIVIQN